MKPLITFLCLSLFFMPVLESRQATQRVKNIHSMLDIHPYLSENPLVIFDLDNTLILSKTDLGSPHWRRAWKQQQDFRGLSSLHSFPSLKTHWLALENYLDYQLTENNIPYLLKNLKQFPKATLYGLSSRPPVSSKLTLQTLDKLNISLEKPSLKHLYFDFLTPHPVLLSEGIVFGGPNPKKLILKELIRNLQQQSQSFDRLIYVDDNPIIF